MGSWKVEIILLQKEKIKVDPEWKKKSIFILRY